MRLWWSLALLCAACSGDASSLSESHAPEPWVVGATRKGATQIRWRPADGPIPFNEYFTLEVELSDAGTGTALEGAELFVRCEMPAHGHGMNVEPKAQEQGAGLYRVDGMLLHMTGEWELGVDVVIDGRAESASFPLTLTLE